MTTCKRCGSTERYPNGAGMTPEQIEKRRQRMRLSNMSPEQVAKKRSRRREKAYRENYNISVEDHDQLLHEQGGLCAICKTDKPAGSGRLNVDHDHATGAVRGLLCHSCNTALGGFGDDVERLQAAIDYLNQSRFHQRILSRCGISPLGCNQ
jgi:hypothetical protein